MDHCLQYTPISYGGGATIASRIKGGGNGDGLAGWMELNTGRAESMSLMANNESIILRNT